MYIFLGKPTDINDGWIRYICTSNAATTVRHCQQFVQPLSPAVSCGNGSCITNSPSASLVAHMCVLCILAAATIQGWCIFHLELPIVQLPFKGGDCSEKYGMKDVYTISKLSISPT